MRGALSSATQKRRKGQGVSDLGHSGPVRVFVPEWGELEALASAPGWARPPPWRRSPPAPNGSGGLRPPLPPSKSSGDEHQTKLAPNKPKALNRTIALCYTGQCPAPERHSGECGPVAQRLHTARRADDLNYRRRAIDAKHWQPSADPWTAGRLPMVGHTAPATAHGGGLHRAGPPLRRLLPPRARPLPPSSKEPTKPTYEAWGVPPEYRPAPR